MEKNEKIFEYILNNINTPVIVINEKTKEYEWINTKAQEIVKNFKIHFDEITDSHIIVNNRLYVISFFNLENYKRAIVLEPVDQSFIDNETNLLNFQGFFIKYETLYFFLTRKKKSLYLSIIEIDNFENIVKNFSYQEALIVSRQVASIIKSKIRNNIDIVSKYNQTCFLVGLTEVDKEKVLKILERIQKSIIDYFKKENPFILTVSSVAIEIIPCLKETEEVYTELQAKIQKLLAALEYEKKIKQNFILVLD